MIVGTSCNVARLDNFYSSLRTNLDSQGKYFQIESVVNFVLLMIVFIKKFEV